MWYTWQAQAQRQRERAACRSSLLLCEIPPVISCTWIHLTEALWMALSRRSASPLSICAPFLGRERAKRRSYSSNGCAVDSRAIPLHQGTSWDDDLLSAIIPVQSTRYWDMVPMCVVCQEGKTSAVYKTGAASLPPPPYQFLLRLASTVCAGHPLAPKSTGR